MKVTRPLLAATLLLAACSDGGEADSPPTVADSLPPTSPAAATTTPATAVTTPGTTNGVPAPTTSPTSSAPSQPAGTIADPTVADSTTAPTAPPPTTEREVLEWYIEVINGRANVTEEMFIDIFSDEFRDEITYEAFGALNSQVVPNGPYTIDNVLPAGDDGFVAVLLASDGTTLSVKIEVDEDGDVDGLSIEPTDAAELVDEPANLDEAIDQLSEYGRLHWVASRIEHNDIVTECVRLDGEGDDNPIAVGSAIKLYVLGALADEITEGDIGWDTELELTDEMKSLPGGILQDRPGESIVRVEEAAQLMIEISDNTAADLLVNTLGAETVEETQAIWGHDDPELNIPMMTTRQLFALKVAAPTTQDRYLAADDATQREILAEMSDVPLDQIPVEAFLTDPVRPSKLDWFASPSDLCEVLSGLLQAGRTHDELEPIEHALTENPGVPSDQWSTIAYKGGNEPGLVTMAWVMENPDGDLYSFVASLVSDTERLDSAQIPLLMAAARDFVGTDD